MTCMECDSLARCMGCGGWSWGGGGMALPRGVETNLVSTAVGSAVVEEIKRPWLQ